MKLSGGYRPADFEPDGSLRDVCVLGAGVDGWERLFEAVAAGPWPYQLERNGEPVQAADFSPAAHFAEVEAGADVSVRLSVSVEPIWFDSFLFEPEEIEFSFSPEDVAEGRNFGSLERFMIWLATVSERQAILTMESSTGHVDAVPLLQTRALYSSEGPG